VDDYAELKARYERLNLLYQVGNVLHSTLDQSEALQLILNEAVRLMRASSGSTVLLNPTTGLLEIHAVHGLPATAAQLKLRVGEGITGWVARRASQLAWAMSPRTRVTSCCGGRFVPN
jgi:signal transduction protein with GAF and PtsI domain